MQRIIFTILLLANCCYLFPQDSYVKVYDFLASVKTEKLEIYRDRIYAINSQFCNSSECSLLIELNSEGDTLWTTLIPDIDVAPGSMVIVNDTITITGNNDSLNTSWRMAHFSLDGEKLGETITIEHPNRKFTKMFQLSTEYFNHKYAICGSGWDGDTILSLIYIVDSKGEIDTLITLAGSDRLTACWDSYIDFNGRLTTYHWVEFDDSAINYRQIIKFDTNYNKVWTYRSENSQYNSVVPNGCELIDGSSIMSYTNPEGIEDIHSVRAIKADKTIGWQYNWGVSPYKVRYILRLKTLRNGDVMGSGYYSENLQNIRLSPWLFRLSPEGELLWSRTYVDVDSINNLSRRGALFDFIEFENGDLMAVGYLNYENSDMLIMRLDSNGCIDPLSCEEINIIDILTDINEISFIKNSSLKIYPNPAFDFVKVEFPQIQNSTDVKIYSTTGQVKIECQMTFGQSEFEISTLPPGLYIISIQLAGRVLAIRKFVKI